jgi:hypothetical protein
MTAVPVGPRTQRRVTATACLEAHGHPNIRATCCSMSACAASFPVVRYPSGSSGATTSGLQPQPFNPHAQGFWLNALSAKAPLQASNFQAQGCRARQAKPRNTDRKPFCSIRDAPSIMRKPLNAARKAQRREMARFGTATARLKTLHAIPTTSGRRAITVARKALSCAFRSFWLARKGQTVADGSSGAARRFSRADARPPSFIRRTSPRSEAPRRHPNACQAPPATTRSGRQETASTAADRPPCALAPTPASRQTASP